jgi:hypothetical protein
MKISKSRRVNSVVFGHVELVIAIVVVASIAIVGANLSTSSHAASYNWTNIGLTNGGDRGLYKIADCQTSTGTSLGTIYTVHLLYSKPASFATQQYFAVVFRPPYDQVIHTVSSNSWLGNTFAEETVTASANLKDYLYVGITDKYGRSYINNGVHVSDLASCD